MRIQIVTPAPPQTLHGNRVTAIRWLNILRELGHQVRLTQSYEGEEVDALIALHAKRSYQSIFQFHRLHSDRPLIVALTGTDLYRDLPSSRHAQTSLQLAARVVTLQPLALQALDARLRRKTSVIFQSAEPAPRRLFREAKSGSFDVCVVGHLRPVKDPFRAALAARLLPERSRARILQFGAAMSPEMAAAARAEMARNPRYFWPGEKPRWRIQQILVRCALCVLSSKMEGGANVLSEAIVNRVPVLASKIPGSVGILGEDYPGYFRVGATDQLTRLMLRAETDPSYLARLRAQCVKCIPLFQYRREKDAWSRLLQGVAGTTGERLPNRSKRP